MDPHRSYKHTWRQRRRWWWCCGAWWEPLVNALFFYHKIFSRTGTASLASSSSNIHQNIWGRSPVPIFFPAICVGIWDTIIWGGEGGRQDDDCYGKSRECSLRCIPPSHHNHPTRSDMSCSMDATGDEAKESRGRIWGSTAADDEFCVPFCALPWSVLMTHRANV